MLYYNSTGVTAGTGGTLVGFTWFCCTWLSNRKAHCCEPTLGCGTDRSDSPALLSQAYAYWSVDRVELSQC
jgi:hypothetical protein